RLRRRASREDLPAPRGPGSRSSRRSSTRVLPSQPESQSTMLSADETRAYAPGAALTADRVRTAIVRAARGRTSSVVISRGAIAASGLFPVLLPSSLLSPDARGVFAALQASVTIMAVCGCASLWLGISVVLPQVPAARRAAVKLAVIWPLCFSAL